ncbi:MAG: cobyric acid synthase [Clostridium sp.]|nr:cobyric acid synthase [Clostridium sp.]
MVQGTSSSVGKSIIATALCRIFTEDGFQVSPFKSQNMSLNSHVTTEGYEMSQSQFIQALACSKAPHVNMNPILLKPTSNQTSQVILMGKAVENMGAADYFKYKKDLKDIIMSAYHNLESESDVVVIEGAGSPAEINLKSDDIVNMGLAQMVDAPVILIADIDRGGVFASIYRTVMLLEEEEKKRIKGIIINKFRGDKNLLMPGVRQIEELVGIKVLGVIPYFNLDLDEEDSVIDWRKFSKVQDTKLDIAVINLPHISNFSDFHPLTIIKDITLRFVDLDEDIGDADLIILPGTISTIEALKQMKESGMDQRILQSHQKGTPLMGISGGYQILGKTIKEVQTIEKEEVEIRGLGIIQMDTLYSRDKNTSLIEGSDYLSLTEVQGYEIHMGKSTHHQIYPPLLTIKKRNNLEIASMNEGIMDLENGLMGTFVHGIFENGNFTRGLLDYLCHKKGIEPLEEVIGDFWIHREKEIDKLGKIVRENIDMESLYDVLHES